jgi:hypothetical protein
MGLRAAGASAFSSVLWGLSFRTHSALLRAGSDAESSTINKSGFPLLRPIRPCSGQALLRTGFAGMTNHHLSLDKTAAPVHPGLPKLLITIFGHTAYLAQGDTMFLGHPNYIVEFPWQNYGYFVYLLCCECKWGGFRLSAFSKVMQMKALCNMETGWRKAENISPVSPFFCAHRIACFVSTVTQIPLGLSLAILEG